MVETPTPPWRILVIDDEPAVQLVLERLFSRMGQKTRRAVNGPEGSAALAGEAWDLVLIDKNLPEGNGIELAKAARAANPTAVVILITGYASRESADALVGVVDEYLTKPFELAQLRDVIGTLMAMRAQGRKLSGPRSSPSGLRPAPAATTSTSRPRLQAVRLDSVHIVVADAREESFLLAAARQTGFSATSGPITDSTQAEVFIVDGRSATLEVRKAVWHRQASNPAFEVVMLVDVQMLLGA